MMTQLLDSSAVHATLATRFAANCVALGLDLPLPNVEPATGRDGSMTAKRDGAWLAGCSVPRLAAERMIRKENWPHRALCLLTPTHGQQLEAVLTKLPPTSALIAVFASTEAVADALACCDVAADAAAGRLHVAWDEVSLTAIFERHPGLAVPRQIVRLPDADAAAVAAAMPWTQAALTGETARQAARVAAAAALTTTDAKPIASTCLLVARRFRLWNDTGDTLTRAITPAPAGPGQPARPGPAGAGARVLDTDHPLTAADAWRAEHVAAAGATIADRPRPTWATSPRPWVAWLTHDEVPAFNPAFAADALLLTSSVAVTAARAAGWPTDRVTLANWPNQTLSHTPGRPLALCYDLPDLAPPADVAELSSRQIVWEAIRDELSRDPFALGDDAERYVRRAPARLGLPLTEDFPVRRFVDGVVAPSFVVGVATWLAARGMAFTLHGRGWDAIESVTAACRGPVAGREAFDAIVRHSGGVVDAFLTPAHPCQALGVPVLAVFGQTPQRVVQDAAAIAAGRLRAPSPNAPLCAAAIRQYTNRGG